MYCCYKTILLNKDTILDFNIVVSLIHIIGGIFLTLVKTTDFNWLLKNDNCRIYFSPRPSRLEFCFYRNRSRKTTFDKITDFNWVLQNSLLAYAFRTTPSSIGVLSYQNRSRLTSLILIMKVGILYSRSLLPSATMKYTFLACSTKLSHVYHIYLRLYLKFSQHLHHRDYRLLISCFFVDKIVSR